MAKTIICSLILLMMFAQGLNLYLGKVKDYSEDDDDEQLLDDYEQLVPKKYRHMFNCKCDNFTGCGCCGQLYIIRLKTHEEACVQFKYRAESTSLTMTFLVGGRMIFSTIKSINNPDPICVSYPGAAMIADICFDFYGLQIMKNKFNVCLKIQPRIAMRQIANIDLGCLMVQGSEEE